MGSTGSASQLASFDPALTLWHKWRAAYFQTEALRQKQQRLETSLVNTIGFPSAGLASPNRSIALSRRCKPDEEVDERKPVADVASHQARWDKADREVGYSAARLEELAAADRERDLVDALMATSAVTFAGVAGKLDAILHEGECSEECTEFPWPHIRSALVDLVRVGQVLEPSSFMPGSDHMMLYRRDPETRTDLDRNVPASLGHYRASVMNKRPVESTSLELS